MLVSFKLDFVCVFNKYKYNTGTYTVQMAAEQETKLVSSLFKHLLLNYLFCPYSVVSDQLMISCAFLALIIVRFSNRWTLEVVKESVICKINLEKWLPRSLNC